MYVCARCSSIEALKMIFLSSDRITMIKSKNEASAAKNITAAAATTTSNLEKMHPIKTKQKNKKNFRA